jgi:hypothetical protein
MAPAEEVAAAVAVVVEAVAMGDQAMGPDQGMVRAAAVEVLVVGMDMVVEAVAARAVELVALGMGPGKDLATELVVVVLVAMEVAEVVEVVVAKVVVQAMAMEAAKATALALAMVVVLLVVAVVVADMVAVVVAAKVGTDLALAPDMGQVKEVVLMEEAMEAVVAVEVAVVKVVALAMDRDLAPAMEVATATDTIRLFLRASYI